jgi:hypothetical protein
MKPCDQFVGSKKAGQCKNATPSTEPYKASRGDPRRAFPDEAAPSQNAREIHRSLPVPLPVPDLVRRGCGAGAIGISA